MPHKIIRHAVVIPVHNEENSRGELSRSLCDIMRSLGVSAGCLFSAPEQKESTAGHRKVLMTGIAEAI